MSDLSHKRLRVVQRVMLALGESVICDRCGATYATMNDKCSALLEERCPGFNRIDEVQVPIEAEIFGFDRAALSGKGGA